MLHVQTILPEQGRVENATFELNPDNPQGEAVCRLVEEFFAGRPPAFQDKLGFMRKGDFSLDWSAAAGGVAMATLFQGQTPASVSVLVSGLHSATDAQMLQGFRDAVLKPLFGGEYDKVADLQVRPLLVQVMLSDEPEWTPALQLLNVSLASVYFRTLQRVSKQSSN